jgi:hypothetical protein
VADNQTDKERIAYLMLPKLTLWRQVKGPTSWQMASTASKATNLTVRRAAMGADDHQLVLLS